MTNTCSACGERMSHAESGFRRQAGEHRAGSGEFYLRLACRSAGCAQAGTAVEVLGTGR